MPQTDMSLAQPHPADTDAIQKAGLAIAALGVLILLIAIAGVSLQPRGLYLGLSLAAIFLGVVVFSIRRYMTQPAGVKNNGVWFKSMTNRGILGWIAGIILTGFYVALYWFPQVLGFGGEDKENTGLVALFDPLSRALNGTAASQWFVYGTLYTVAILSMGIKFILKYRHNKYHRLRTYSVMGSQLFFAYLIPEILYSLNKEATFSKDIKLFWPLDYSFFDSWSLDAMRSTGTLGMFYLTVGIALFTIVTPFLSYFFGKRWYCSWVCGCGGLAETAGDPYRHLSSKKLYAWKIERWLVHSVLVLVVIMTFAVLYGYYTNSQKFLGLDTYTYFSKPYGFVIGAIFSGIIGVGFYPILGNRVWCRFGCPLAAYLGIFQRFKSKFRITTNGGQCISCGNCSTYCEQGIDVRWYAQRGENIVRASCVGCGICSAVCPRGVLKLENGPEEGRINEHPIQVGINDIKVKT